MKLYYFIYRGKGEMIRLMLHLCKTPFEDIRIDPKDWPERRKEFELQLPVLELDNGQRFNQSVAILSYLAREKGYYGTTNRHWLEISQVTEYILDFWKIYVEALHTQDTELKAQKLKVMSDVHFPAFFQKLEELLTDNGTGFFVGTSISAADLAVFSVVEDQAVTAYPQLNKLKEHIKSIPEIEAYLRTRPTTAV